MTLYQKTEEEKKNNTGHTFDTYPNIMSKKNNGLSMRARLDRYVMLTVFFTISNLILRLYYTSETLEPVSMEILGTEPFEDELWPSDHWGIFATLKIK